MAAVIEAQARLNVTLRDLIIFFQQSTFNIQPRSINILESYIEKHLTIEFLLLCESFGRSMAFLNHDELINLLFNSWTIYLEGFKIERDYITHKIKRLKENKKVDPAVIQKQELLLQELKERRIPVIENFTRLQTMKLIPIEKFKENSVFDFKSEYFNIMSKEREQLLLLNPPKPKSALSKETLLKVTKSSTKKGKKK